MIEIPFVVQIAGCDYAAAGLLKSDFLAATMR
jgi:hypothetical protein